MKIYYIVNVILNWFVGTIGELQATNLQHLSTIKDLKSQLGMLQDRLKLMENTQKSMMSKNTEQEQATLNQLKALEKVSWDWYTVY